MVRLVVIVALLVLGGCGAGGSVGPSSAPVPASVTVTASSVRSVGKTCTVPDVVGMVHQTAQDTMQASGLYVLLERDASGQGRLLINDRNWVTTGQEPAAGSVVDCGVEVTLTAKKMGE